MSYYNDASLLGGWSYNSVPAVTQPAMPTRDQLIDWGSAIFNNQTPEIQDKIRNIMTTTTGAQPGDVALAIGAICVDDALKMAYTQATDPTEKTGLGVRYRLFHESTAPLRGYSFFRKLRNVFHLRRDLKTKRQPALQPGPYKPYSEIGYFYSPGRQLSWTRQKRKHTFPLTGLNWGQTPAGIGDLPPPLPRFTQLTPAQKKMLSDGMKQLWQQIRGMPTTQPPPPPPPPPPGMGPVPAPVAPQLFQPTPPTSFQPIDIGSVKSEHLD